MRRSTPIRRILGIDYGRVRVGLALSDPLCIIAQPLSVIPSRSAEALFEALADVISEREVTEIVLGLPLQLDGAEGPAAAEVRRFAEELRERFALPVALWDERLSTARAEREMLSSDMSRAGRKKRRDKVAAQMFLQNYLDAQRSNES